MPWYHGWNVVFAGLVFQAVSFGVALYCFTFFVEPWSSEFSVGRGEIMVIFFILQGAMGLLAPFAGRAMDRLPIRALVCGGAVSLALALVLAARATALWQLMAIYGSFVVGGTLLAGPLAAQTLTARWFTRRRGFALGISTVGTSMGGFFLPFARELGEPVPDFDFRVPGVWSLSADLHKFGYAPKGASVLLFADAEHNAGLGDKAATLRVAEDGAGAVVAGLHADGFLQAFDGLEVVVVDVGLGVEDDIDVLHVAFEIGHQNFDRGSGAAVLDGANRHRPDGGTTVGEFIAGDTGDDAVFEIHLRHGVGDAGGFAEVELCGTASLDRAEIAGARADVAEDHHGGGAAGPAFAEVGALRALADGVQFVLVDELAGGVVAGAGRQFGSEPGGLARGVH